MLVYKSGQRIDTCPSLSFGLQKSLVHQLLQMTIDPLTGVSEVICGNANDVARMLSRDSKQEDLDAIIVNGRQSF
jgi:hypothetical protein